MAQDRLDQLDYYTLLGVPRNATIDRVREGFHAFAIKYHPDRHAGADPAKVARAAEIYRRGAEAYRILLDADLRYRYDLGLEEGRLRFDPDAPDKRRSRNPSTAPLMLRSSRARPFAQKAEMAIRAKDWKTALLNLRIAMQHEPDNELLEARLAMVETELALKAL